MLWEELQIIQGALFCRLASFLSIADYTWIWSLCMQDEVAYY